jgi:thiamine-phosphate pyrophosphorylase
MLFKLPTVYPITDVQLSGFSHAEQVAQLIAGGATLIQLREKHLAPHDFYRDAAAALRVARNQGVRVIINDRVDIALALGADGVHLGQTDLPPTDARRLLGNNTIIGFSTHNLEQIQRAKALPISYLAIGPVFETSSKHNPDAVVGLDGLQRARALIGNISLVAIGGITLENVQTVFQAGADSVAIIKGLLEGSQIEARTRQMLALARK